MKNLVDHCQKGGAWIINGILNIEHARSYAKNPAIARVF